MIVNTHNPNAQGLMILANWLRHQRGHGSIRSCANLVHPTYDISSSQDTRDITLNSHGLLGINGPLPRVYQEWVTNERQLHKNEAAHRLLDLLAQPLTLKDLAAWGLTRPAVWSSTPWPVRQALAAWAGHLTPCSAPDRLRTLRLNFHGQSVQRIRSQEVVERMVASFTGLACQLKPLQHARHEMSAQWACHLGQLSMRLGRVRLGTTLELRSSRIVFDFSGINLTAFSRLVHQNGSDHTTLADVLKDLLPAHIEPVCSATLTDSTPMILGHAGRQLGISSVLGKPAMPVVIRWIPYRITLPNSRT